MFTICKGYKKAIESAREYCTPPGCDGDCFSNYDGNHNWFQHGAMIIKHPCKRLYFVGPDSITKETAIYYMNGGQ